MNCSKLKRLIYQLESSDFEQAKNMQTTLADKITLIDRYSSISRIAGLDVGFEDKNTVAVGGIVILNFPGLQVIEKRIARRKVIFPYVPGYLSFREIPVLLECFAQIQQQLFLMSCDGQGISHPRRFGLACHLGLLLDLPAIGAGKTKLIGHYLEPAISKGACTPLIDKDEIIGMVLRSRRGTRPLFVSPGHKISIKSAVKWTLNCCTRYRIPQTTRQAHKLVSG